MTPRLLTWAEAGFEAARHEDGQLRGHGFRVDVSARLHDIFHPDWPDDGLLGPRLQQRLEQAVAALLRRCGAGALDAGLTDSDDAALAEALAEALALPGLLRLGLRSQPTRGLDRPAGGRAPEAWRRYRFESAHRLPHVPPGHKCGRWHGHGFEAVIRARGTPPAAVLHARLDAAWAPLHERLHLRRLNDLPGLKNPTSEHLARWIRDALAPGLPGLSGVTVFETATCGAHADAHQVRIWKDVAFDSATRLRRLPADHPRAGLHGHTYLARLHLQAPLDPVLGWAVDFGDVKQAFAPVFEAVDHRDLDGLPGLADGDAASLAQWLLAQARPRLPQLFRVDVFETPACGASALLPDPDGTEAGRHADPADLAEADRPEQPVLRAG